MKAELTHQRTFTSDAELNAALANYIDRFYNQKRIHSGLGYHSPVEYERLVNAQFRVRRPRAPVNANVRRRCQRIPRAGVDVGTYARA